MEPVYTTDNVKFYIDFAHTPDGLEKTLSFAAKNKKNGKLIVVCGAPGNRDKEKRPMMGDIALKYADITIFSDDDPDTENRLKILHDMTKNIQSTFIPEEKEVFIIPEREYALKFVAEIATAGDIVVLAGKGHELMQLTNFGKRPRSDKKILIKHLEREGKQFISASEIKKQSLEEMKDRKNPHHLTVENYIS
jgi:UDP-N-acetylmuramoyl-L-alanyl-D-glutamate--2,6-diaminopimelate ligase